MSGGGAMSSREMGRQKRDGLLRILTMAVGEERVSKSGWWTVLECVPAS